MRAMPPMAVTCPVQNCCQVPGSVVAGSQVLRYGLADGERGGRGPDGGGGQAGGRGGLCRGERGGELRFRWAGRAAAFREGAPGRRPQACPGGRARHAARGGGDSGVAQEGPPGGFPGPSVG